MGEIRVRVAAVILDPQGRLLLARHQRDGQDYWLLPGGGLEFGETLEEALRRELLEECRLKIKVSRPILMSESIPPDKHRHVLNICFLAEIESGSAELGEPGSERLKEVAFKTLDEARALVIRPDIKDELLSQWSAGFALPFESLGASWKP